MGAAVVQPIRHAAVQALRNAARAHASRPMVLAAWTDGTPRRDRPLLAGLVLRPPSPPEDLPERPADLGVQPVLADEPGQR